MSTRLTQPFDRTKKMKTRIRRQLRQQRARQQGVVLLVVLSLLTLFIIVGTTFLLVAQTYSRGASASPIPEYTGDPPDKLMDMALYQVLRGTRDPRSVVRGHDLLGDFYGTDGLVGLMQNWAYAGGVNNPTSSQLIDIEVNPNNLEGLYNRSLTVLDKLVHLSTVNYYKGCVFTFTTGPAKGYSTRIVKYTPPQFIIDPLGNLQLSTNAIFRIVTPANDEQQLVLPETNDRFVVNGRPFNGTGFSLNGDANGDERLLASALLPNWAGFAEATFAQYIFGTDTDSADQLGNGGPDEDWDAPDYQNLALTAILPLDNDVNTIKTILPAFHRPELWQYHQLNNPGQLSRVIMRPTYEPAIGINTATADFPNASGLLNFNELTGPWDVDNDGDGVLDSIWVDLNLPIKTAPNGRQYKPLFAFMVVDLDSRLNLNYAGSRSQAVLNEANPVDAFPGGALLARNPTVTTLPRGNGWGPADINLITLFRNPNLPNPDQEVAARTAYSWLLRGVGGYPGRYGRNPNPGTFGTDVLTPIKFFPFSANYFNAALPPSAFATPFDLRAELAFGLDPRGAPTSETPADMVNDILSENPYELSSSALRGQQTSAVDPNDQLFSLDELERILRIYDIDADQLPPRLLRLFDRTEVVNVDTNNDGTPEQYTVDIHTFTNGYNAAANRRMVTTESYDVPAPGGVASEDVLDRDPEYDIQVPQTIVDVFGRRLRAGIMQRLGIPQQPPGVPYPPAQVLLIQNQINQEIAKMVSPDLFAGLRMDINRPLGNGRDDNFNLVVDESEESHFFNNGLDDDNDGSIDEMDELTLQEQIWFGTSVDHDNDGTLNPDADSFLIRYHMARHLYCLAMMLKDRQADLDWDGDGNATNVETAYYIAQWAINAVDFRDTDCVMTPFEFDTDPYDGWQVNGDPASPNEEDRGLVWGCERPELLISETIAWHDRRTEDLDNPAMKIADGDDDFDQRLQPQGAFFVELYNPWAGPVDRRPAELYDAAAQGVQLNKVTANGSPVWRLTVVTGASQVEDPDAPPPFNNFQQTDVERRVYCSARANLPANISTEPGVQVHAIGTTQQLRNIAPVPPGRFGVIGTGRYATGSGANRDYVTTVGRRSDAVDGGLKRDATRQVVLTPNPNPNLNQVLVLNNERQDVAPAPPGPQVLTPPGFQLEPSLNDRQAAVAVVIDSPDLTLSEPTGGYPPALGPPTPDGEAQYNPPLDQPLDSDPLLTQTGTTPSPYRTVLLQRLANPLQNYDPVLNPYLTIDKQQVYLTAFNGMVPSDTPEQPGQLPMSPAPAFRTLERCSGPMAPMSTDEARGRPLWASFSTQFNSNPTLQELPPPPVPRPHNFDFYMIQSLGYLNQYDWPYFRAASMIPTEIAPAPAYIGGPASNIAQGPPYPWLTWNNRPYLNQYELLQVPFTSSSRLLQRYTLRNNGDPYDAQAALHTFGHLLRWLNSSTDPGTDPATHFYRLLEYTGVPSLFLDTELYFNPAHFQVNDPLGGTSDFHPPYNWISRYREPGKININTVYDYRIWEQALRNGLPGPTFSEIVASRRGYTGVLSSYDAIPSLPTRFANPFRSSATAQFVPPLSGGATLVRNEVECTLLRSGAVDATDPPTQEPLLCKNASQATHNNSVRNPYFEYQTPQHMGNLVTTRSNVYAVWVTVGFFEMDFVLDPNTGQPVLDPNTGLPVLAPGRELSSETGDVRRHRAFYVIDRTIPVAYEPGQNHNVDRAVVLRRIIE